MRQPKVLVVGQNPSVKNTNIEVPFEGTASGRRLRTWLSRLRVSNATVINAYRGLDTPKVIYAQRIPWPDYDKIVALGNFAEEVLLSQGCYNYIKLPHPSGLNRKNNDLEYVDQMLAWCELYIHGRRL